MTSEVTSFKTCVISKMVSAQLMSAEIGKLYYSAKSPVTVLRELKKKYPAENIKKNHVYRAVKRFEETGSVTDGRHRNSDRPKSVRSAENIAEVRQVIGETPQMSVRKVLGNISNQTSRTSVHWMLRFDLKFTPYTIFVMQHLKNSDIESRLLFALWMEENYQIANVI